MDFAKAIELGDAHTGSVKRIEQAASDFETELRESLVANVPAEYHRQTLEASAEMLKQKTAEHRQALIEKERWAFEDRRKQLARLAADASAFSRTAPSPRALLEAATHEDPARFTALLGVLSGARPATLATHVALFTQNPGDRILGAALARALDGVEKNLRPASPQDIADAAVGATWRDLRHSAAIIEYEDARARIHETAARENRRVTPREHVQLGQLHRAAGLNQQKAQEPAIEKLTPLQKINRGLAARRAAAEKS